MLPLLCFIVLFVLSGGLFVFSLKKNIKLPKGSRRKFIWDLSTSMGLLLMYINFIFGYSVLNLYSKLIGAFLMAFWLLGVLFILSRLKISSVAFIGALGVVIICRVVCEFSLSDIYLLVAIALGFGYYITLLYLYRRENLNTLTLYVVCAVSSVLLLTNVNYIKNVESILIQGIVLLAVLVPYTLLSFCTNAIVGNIIYAAQIVITGLILSNVVKYEVIGCIAFSKTLDLSVFYGGQLIGVYRLMMDYPIYLPGALVTLLLLTFDFSTPLIGIYCPAIVILTIMLIHTSKKGLEYPVLRKCVAFLGPSVLVIMATVTIFKPAILSGLALLVAGFVLCRVFVKYLPDAPYGQYITLMAAVIMAIACFVMVPSISLASEIYEVMPERELWLSIMLSGTVLGVFVLYGADEQVDTQIYRRLLLFFSTMLSIIWVCYAFNGAMYWLSFIGVLVFIGALFKRYVLVFSSVIQSIWALVLISGQIFFWLYFLVPDGFEVAPSIILIALGFWIIRYSFRKKRKAECIFGLVLVLLSVFAGVFIAIESGSFEFLLGALIVGIGVCAGAIRLFVCQNSSIKSRLIE